MITRDSVQSYRGPSPMRGPDYVYIRPNPLLAPYIANYTVTCPSPDTMPDQYTIMPTASATLIYRVGANAIVNGLRGVNTRASVVGSYANRFKLLLLVEFHPAGLYPLLGVPQSELLDDAFSFEALDRRLHNQILTALLGLEDIQSLKSRLDRIFLAALSDKEISPPVAIAMRHILASNGSISANALSKEVFYSEKQLGRLFRQHIGVGVKTFSRIVRVNSALRLLEEPNQNLASVAARSGYFDQPHFIRDFRTLCGVSPQGYLDRMSVFYNDRFKL